MESIEERAKKYFGVFINGKCISYNKLAVEAYILGATEQGEIDEELMLKKDGYKQGFFDGFVEALIAVKKELRKAEADDLYDYKNAIITLETEQKNIVKNLLKQLEE